MEKNSSNIRKYLLLTIVCVLIIIIVIILIINKNFETKYEYEEHPDEEYYEIGLTEFEVVTDASFFFKIEDCLNLYYEYLNINEFEEEEYIPGMEESTATIMGITSEDEKRQAIIDVLSSKYIKENNITAKNLYDFVEAVDLEKYKIQISKEEVYTNSNIKNCYVVGKIINKDNYKVMKNIYFIVNSNVEDDCFSIYPLDKEPKNLKDLINNEKIDENNYNVVPATVITDEEKVVKYFSNFKMNAINKTDYAFELLDEEYRKKRFNNSREEFDKYIDSNIDEISQNTLKKYMFQTNGGNREYICKDKYDNFYIFEESGIMQYTVKLDTYTIESDEFKETYEKASEQDKIGMNIDKWFSMLNNRDYQAAYKVLDETFRNDNFGSVDQFEEYMRELYPLHYTTEKGNIKKESNAYIQDIIIKDITEEDKNEYDNNIIMQLKEGTEFSMSFYIRRK